MPKEISAGAIIFRKDNSKIYYLLLHYTAGHWDFPKGNIERGEQEEKTVRREVKEETGIEDIKIIDGFKEYVKYFYQKNYKLSETRSLIAGQRPGLGKAPWIFKIVTFYLAETKTPHQSKHGAGQAKEVYPVRNGVSNGVKISFEHQDYKWLLYEEALKQLTFKNAKEILKKANDFLNSKIKNQNAK